MSSRDLASWSIVPIEQYLEENENVHNDLEWPTDPELDWGLPDDEVDGLERVTTKPHQDHLYTAESK